MTPFYAYLPYAPVSFYLASLKGQEKLAVFQSNESGSGLSQYSYIAWQVVESFVLTDIQQAQAFFDTLKQKQKAYALKECPILPPFQGGFAGVLAYDLGEMTEPFIRNIKREALPLAEVNVYAMVLAFDHVTQSTCLIATGWPASSNSMRESHAKTALAHWGEIFGAVDITNCQQPLAHPYIRACPHYAISRHNALNVRESQRSIHEVCEQRIADNQGGAAEIVVMRTRPTQPTGLPTPLRWQAAIPKAAYLKKIEAIQECIRDGEIFEVNFANAFTASLPPQFNSFEYYLYLTQQLKEDFGGYFAGAGYTILSYSPERFLKNTKGLLEARPIKGTIKRETDSVKDRQAKETLLNSEKDKAENTMIVDLMRNDFSKIAEDESVRVTQLCGLETKAAVHHLVSVIQGKLKKDHTLWDALLALFPAGSITGAPKRQSMKVIDRFEVLARQFYCGHLFYLSHANVFDSAILIRSLFITDNTMRCYGGGAITLLSDPESEWAEIEAKIAKLGCQL